MEDIIGMEVSHTLQQLPQHTPGIALFRLVALASDEPFEVLLVVLKHQTKLLIGRAVVYSKERRDSRMIFNLFKNGDLPKCTRRDALFPGLELNILYSHWLLQLPVKFFEYAPESSFAQFADVGIVLGVNHLKI